MDVSSSLVYFYPRVFALHTLSPEEEGIPEQMRSGVIIIHYQHKDEV